MLYYLNLPPVRGIEQKGFHNFDVFDHSIYSCDGAPRNNPEVRLAALLHDIGKPATLANDELGIPTFYGHEKKSTALSRKIIQRFKFPKAFEKKVLLLVEHHMFNYQPEWSDSAVRRFIAKTGTDNIMDLFLLRRADQYGMNCSKHDSVNLADFGKRIKNVLDTDNAFAIKDLNINGNILHSKGGIPKGRDMGTTLEFLLESVLDDPSQNNETDLLKIAVNFYNERLTPKK